MLNDNADRLDAAALLDDAIRRLQAARTAILSAPRPETAEEHLTEAEKILEGARCVVEGIVDGVWCAENPGELVR